MKIYPENIPSGCINQQENIYANIHITKQIFYRNLSVGILYVNWQKGAQSQRHIVIYM